MDFSAFNRLFQIAKFDQIPSNCLYFLRLFYQNDKIEQLLTIEQFLLTKMQTTNSKINEIMIEIKDKIDNRIKRMQGK